MNFLEEIKWIPFSSLFQSKDFSKIGTQDLYIYKTKKEKKKSYTIIFKYITLYYIKNITIREY